MLLIFTIIRRNVLKMADNRWKPVDDELKTTCNLGGGGKLLKIHEIVPYMQILSENPVKMRGYLSYIREFCPKQHNLLWFYENENAPIICPIFIPYMRFTIKKCPIFIPYMRFTIKKCTIYWIAKLNCPHPNHEPKLPWNPPIICLICEKCTEIGHYLMIFMMKYLSTRWCIWAICLRHRVVGWWWVRLIYIRLAKRWVNEERSDDNLCFVEVKLRCNGPVKLWSNWFVDPKLLSIDSDQHPKNRCLKPRWAKLTSTHNNTKHFSLPKPRWASLTSTLIVSCAKHFVFSTGKT